MMEPYWHNLNVREAETRIRSELGTLDWSILLTFGENYIDSEYRYRTMIVNRPRLMTVETKDEVIAREDSWQASFALDDVADMTRVPVNVIVNAARVVNRYYDRGGSRLVDAEKLIRSMV